MDSSSGTSSGSTTILTNSGSEGDLQQHAVDERKQKRILSNRESARRSRMRKKKHLDDLKAQVAQLMKENNQILATYKASTQQYLAVEAENSVLRTQMMELSTRLQSLSEILDHLDGNRYLFDASLPMDCFINPWGLNKIITASADFP